jgi:hypothetical protein
MPKKLQIYKTSFPATMICLPRTAKINWRQIKGLNKVKNISEDLLENGFNVRMPTTGLSMFPLIQTGDRITITPQKDLAIGDLVVFAREDNVVCHELINIFERDGSKYYQTRGVGHFSLDEPVAVDQILGKVVRIERDNISLTRKSLLFLYPILKFGRLNAFLISVLMGVRDVLVKLRPLRN